LALPTDGRYYNLATGHLITKAQPGKRIFLSPILPVAGTPELLTEFARKNNLEPLKVLNDEPVHPVPRVVPITAAKIEDIPFELLNSLTDFNLNGVEAPARVLTLYDGDTLHLAVMVTLRQLGQGQPSRNGIKRSILASDLSTRIVLRQRVRLAEIDAAEMKLNGRVNPLGQKALDVLNAFLKPANYYVTARFGHNDKYGRPLTTIWTPGVEQSINQQLLNYVDPIGDVLFKSYDGGKRTVF
jgi:endonuclease YncB( thermonuclease family)